MNKIIELNEEYGFAIVEPGVSFVDLYDEIQQNGLNLWPSPPAIGWGPVIGNTLDRGFGYTPNGVHTESQCGMEVVLPNGDLLRTGMGAMADSSTFALYRGAFGPSLDGLFLQSNFGIVTKLGIQITPAPEAYAYVEASVPNEDDLAPLIGTLSDLMRRSIILNSPSIGNIFRIALSSQAPEVHARIHDQEGAEQGYIPYRTHVCHMERVAGKLDFNNDAFRRFTTLMKDTLDPNGILSPGKSGIWNSAVRQP